MKKSSVVLLGCLFSLLVEANDWQLVPSPPILAAKAYVLMDADTGNVLVEKNMLEHRDPASLTKLMTTYITVKQLHSKKINEDDVVSVSVKAWKTAGSRMFIQPQHKPRVIDLLRGVIIHSGNDASVALAEYVAGSEEAFVQLMNQEAARLGMKNTHFANAHGYPEKDPASEHYSSAYDLALLSRAIIKEDKEYYSIHAEREFAWNGMKAQPNRNGLLWKDDSIDGLKTGMTDAAGFCLAASAKRGKQRFISIVLGSSSARIREEETQKLLNYGFRFYSNYVVAKANEIITSYRVFKGQAEQVDFGIKQDFVLTIVKGQEQDINQEIFLTNHHLIAPIKRGDKLGELVVKSQDKELARIDVIALNDVEVGSLSKRLLDTIKLWWYALTR